jgi:hypothetical protein
MKKIKWSIMTFAILLSIGGVFATHLYGNSRHQTGLYYFNGTQYLPAGTFGVDYVCTSSPQVCTYLRNGNTYTPYQTLATYFPLKVVDKDLSKKKNK